MSNDLADLRAELSVAQSKVDNALIGARVAEKSAQDAGAALARVQAALKDRRWATPKPAPETETVALAVRPKVACQMLSCGKTNLYQLIGAGEVDVFKRGKATLISTSSIRAAVARGLAAKTPMTNAPPVRRGPRRSREEDTRR